MIRTLPYNLQTRLAEVAGIEANCTAGVGEEYLSEICYQAVADNDCHSFWFKDITDYTDLTRIDPTTPTNNYVYVSLWKISDGAIPELIQPETNIGLGGKIHYTDLEEGCYEVRVRAFVHLIQPDDDVYYERTVAVTLDCCALDRERLACRLRSKIASLACTIREYSYIARDSSKLLNGMYKLQAILWALNEICECYPRCEDVRLFTNATNKVISTCNC